MPGMLEDKVVAVIGGSGGIGSAICRAFANAGATCIVAYNNNEQAAIEVLTSLRGEGHWTCYVPVDITPALEDFAQEVDEKHGKLDILINCAGVTKFVSHNDLDALDDDLIDLGHVDLGRGTVVGQCVRQRVGIGEDPVQHAANGVVFRFHFGKQFGQQGHVGPGHSGQRIVQRQQLGGLVVRQIEHQDGHFHLRRRLCPKMPVDQLQRAEGLQRDPGAAVFLGSVVGKQATAFAGLGQTRRARAEAMRALELWPDNPDSRYILAYLLEQDGYYSAAAAQLDTLLISYPDDVQARRVRERLESLLKGSSP